MTREEILAALREIVAMNFEIDPELLLPDAELRAHLGMDSLDLVDLTFFVKHRFGIEDGADAYKNLRTLGDIAGFVELRQEET